MDEELEAVKRVPLADTADIPAAMPTPRDPLRGVGLVFTCVPLALVCVLAGACFGQQGFEQAHAKQIVAERALEKCWATPGDCSAEKSAYWVASDATWSAPAPCGFNAMTWPVSGNLTHGTIYDSRGQGGAVAFDPVIDQLHRGLLAMFPMPGAVGN
jgi:hypothetical protein